MQMFLHTTVRLDALFTCVSLLGVPVNGGYYSSRGWGGGLLLSLLSQVLAYIGGGVGAFQLGLLTLPITTGIQLCWLRWFLFDCGWCGGWGLGNYDLGRVQVDPIGWGMVVSVGPRHCVKELGRNMEKETVRNKDIGIRQTFLLTFIVIYRSHIATCILLCMFSKLL